MLKILFYVLTFFVVAVAIAVNMTERHGVTLMEADASEIVLCSQGIHTTYLYKTDYGYWAFNGFENAGAYRAYVTDVKKTGAYVTRTEVLKKVKGWCEKPHYNWGEPARRSLPVSATYDIIPSPRGDLQ